MKLVLARCSLINDLVAAPWFVVLLLSLLAEHVADVIAIALLELVHVHLLGKLLLPERVCLVHGQTKTLDEETKLETPVVLQVVLVPQGCHQGLHARWERLSRVEV